MRTFLPINAFLRSVVDPTSSDAIYVQVNRVEQYAGMTIGTAMVSYPGNRGDNSGATMGTRCYIQLGENQVIFRGAMGSAPVRVSANDDDVDLVLFDDKWLMSGMKVGQMGVGTQGDPPGLYGFKDVGFDLVFNRDGKPNMALGERDFSLGTNAQFWTLRDIITLIFDYYVPADVATLGQGEIEHAAWDRKPSHLNLVGQSATQAVDTLAQLAGESWTLTPSSTVSLYKSVRPSHGTLRRAQLFAVGSGADVESATESHPSSITIGRSIESCRDVFQAVSAPIVIESVYSTANGLLTGAAVTDKEYAYRYSVNVAKYDDNGLGKNRSAGAPPKPWLSALVTRKTASGGGYETAAGMATNPQKIHNKRVEIPVWLATDGVEANAKLLTGGYRIDIEKGTIEFKSKVDYQIESGVAGSLTMYISSWAGVGIWMTVATVMETPQSKQSTDAQTYLLTPIYELIEKNDLVPEWRYNSWLPDLDDGDPHAISKVATDDVEKYIDVADALQEVVDSAVDATPEIEAPIECTFEMFPCWFVGDRLEVLGRNLGQTGAEVIVSVLFDVHEEWATRVKATNLMCVVDPERFVRR